MVAKQYIKNPLLYVSVIIILIALFLGAKDSTDWYNQNLAYLSEKTASDVNLDLVQRTINLFNGYDVFINGVGYGNSGFYPILIMLVIGFLFTGNFAHRLSDGSGITEITRIGYRKYHSKEIAKNFIGTFIFTVMVLLIFLGICLWRYSCVMPTKGYSPELMAVTNMYYSHPLLYCLIQIINQGVFLGLLSLLCMGTVCLNVNTFVNRISMLVVYLFLTVVSQMLFRFIGIPFFVLIFPDLIFVPFNIDGGTVLGFIGEKVCAYLLLVVLVICVQLCMYKKYRSNYLR